MMASNLTGRGENTKVTPVHKEAISEDVLRRIYVLAQDMCPTPLAFERLQSWVRRSPDFSVHFKATLKGSESTPIGVIVVLPLIGKVWDDLVVGKIKESDIEPSTMFASESGADVGLHVFYLERFDSAASLCNFFEAVHDMARSIALWKDWNLKGFSGKSILSASTSVSASHANQSPQPLQPRRRGACLANYWASRLQGTKSWL